MATVADIVTTGYAIPAAQVDARAFVCKFATTLTSAFEVPLSTGDIAPKMSSSLSSVSTHNGGTIPVHGVNTYDWNISTLDTTKNTIVKDIVEGCHFPTNLNNRKLGKMNVFYGEDARHVGIPIFDTANKSSAPDGGAEQWSMHLPIWGNSIAFTAPA